MFETRDLGALILKGFPDPIGAWTVLKAHATESRFQATRGEHLTDLIGREEELEILQRRWRRAKDGEGQLVLISGEPGIGKSRLSQALQDAIVDEPHTVLRYQCSPYHTNSALRPIIEQFERAAGMEPDDSPDIKLDKLEATLARSNKPVEDTASLIASLLSIPVGDRYPALNISPQRQKELTLDALVGQLVGLAEQQPVLFLFEDAHWIDPTTRELLDLAVERVPDAAVLMLITHRPEFEAPWVGRARVTPMILNRLEQRDCAIMVENVAKSFGIADELRDRIANQTDGVPLFIEELTKSVLETTSDSGAAIEVPATLQDSLEARLDR
jgi:predicted ATPase